MPHQSPAMTSAARSRHEPIDARLYGAVVILGGRGLLAQALTNALRDNGISCDALGRDECDITRVDQLKKLFRERRPTLIFNCAAYTAVDACEHHVDRANHVNGDAAGSLASLCRRYKTHLVHFSTDFVFDGTLDRPYRSDDPTHPLSAYGRSKLLGEMQIQQVGPPSWMVVRTSWLFGRGGTCFPAKILELARANVPLRIVNDQIGSPTYVVDLAAAVLSLVNQRARGVWHLSNAGATNWFEFAKAVLDECGVDRRVVPISTQEWLMMRPGQAKRPMYSSMDTTYFSRATGRRMRDWQDALKDYGAELREAEQDEEDDVVRQTQQL